MMVQKLPKDKTYAIIQHDAFILNSSIKENIMFGADSDNGKFLNILKVVGMWDYFDKNPEEQFIEVDSNYFRTYSPRLLF